MIFAKLTVLYLVGLVTGVILHAAISRIRSEGVIKIDTSDPKKDIYSLELDIPIDDLGKKSYVTFSVKKSA